MTSLGSALPLPERHHNQDLLVEFLLFLCCMCGEAPTLCTIRGGNSSVGRASLSIQPSCAIAYINICAHVKNSKHWRPYNCLDTRKYCTRCQKWVGLPLWQLCLTWVKQPEFPARDSQLFILKKGLKMAISG